MGADLANNKDYKNVIRAVGLGENYINIPANFRVANSKEYLLQELWQKDREYYFLTNRQEHQTNKQDDRFLIIYVNFKGIWFYDCNGNAQFEYCGNGKHSYKMNSGKYLKFTQMKHKRLLMRQGGDGMLVGIKMFQNSSVFPLQPVVLFLFVQCF